MRTITVSDETAEFLAKLAHQLETQDRRCTADPYYFTVRKIVEVGVPEGCGDREAFFDNHDCENYSEGEAEKRAEELEMEFDDYVHERCHKYDVRDEERFENFFFTLEGYNEHVRRNGHNIARTCKSYDSYVGYAARNPELEGVIKALKEIGKSLNEEVQNGTR